MEKLFIGVDPDVNKNGVGYWRPEKKIFELENLTFFKLFDVIYETERNTEDFKQIQAVYEAYKAYLTFLKK